jgi:glycosyltransferase involved in cell wall biosynthesis
MTSPPLSTFARRDPVAAASRAAPSRGSSVPIAPLRAKPRFAINGRFLVQPITGVQRYAREIVGALDVLLAGTDHDVTLIAPRDAAPDLDLRSIAAAPLGPGSGHAWEQAALPLRLDRRLLNLCNTAPALRRNDVVCIHDANVFCAPESYSWQFRRYYRTLHRWMARRDAVLTSVSRYSATNLAKFLDVPVSRIEVIPNGHEHALRWNAARSSLDADLLRRPYVLLLASRARHKNIGLIVGLAAELDALGLDVKIAGGSARIFQPERWAQSPNVSNLGRVSDDDLARLMQNALCLAFPSLSEGFGLPLLEAMVCNCPIVASNASSIPEVCGDAALLADPHDGVQWLNFFIALTRSRTLPDELRGRGRERAKRFSWAASASRYLEIMSE